MSSKNNNVVKALLRVYEDPLFQENNNEET